MPADPGARDRPAADLPAEQIGFGLDELTAGPLEREMQVVRNVDRLRARLVADHEALDAAPEYRDATAPARGDWYFLRIGQTEGAMAWSSPWWVVDR